MDDWTLSPTDSWSLLHDVALLYLTAMHGPDDEIHAAESDTIKGLLRTRSGGAGNVDRVFDEVMLMYVGSSGDEMIAASIASLGQSLSQRQRRDVLQELTQIATADGLVYESEIQLLAEIANRWGIGGLHGGSATDA